MTMQNRANAATKRAIDIAGAFLGLLVLAPLIVVIAIAVQQRLGRPVLFRQQRPGLNGQVFTLIKFRTMLEIDDASGCVTNEERMTPFGSKLRKTSLDELPSLWNILKGDMSLVGPRPLVVEYLDRYTPEQAHRHDVRPGLTGLVQVNGRNGLSWDEKFALDIEYVDRCSLALDLRVLAKTFGVVLRREGISSPGEVVGAHFQVAVCPTPTVSDGMMEANS